MIEIDNKENCTSCSACFNICPVNAIEMVEDNEGFKYPKVNKEKCINCHLCEKVCPIKNKYNAEENAKKPTVIAAWTKNVETRLDSTSGGVFTELANQIYDEGGYVCGAIYNKEWMVEHIVSNDRKDIDKIRSSKYLQSNINYVFKEIKEKLNKGHKVLMCGSPCQIAGLYNFLGKKYENLYTADFICRGMNSPKIFKGYLNELESKYNSKIVRIKFKNKIHGWHNFSTRIDFENKKRYIGGRYIDSYMIGYLKYNAFMRPSCYNCKFKDLPRMADITLADFWGIEDIDEKLDNNQGTSMVLLNSNKGKELFEKIKNNISYKEINSEKVFKQNVCMKESPEKTEARKKVFENIDKMTYRELCDNYFPQPNTIQQIKIKIRENRALNKVKRKVKKVIFRRK